MRAGLVSRGGGAGMDWMDCRAGMQPEQYMRLQMSAPRRPATPPQAGSSTLTELNDSTKRS